MLRALGQGCGLCCVGNVGHLRLGKEGVESLRAWDGGGGEGSGERGGEYNLTESPPPRSSALPITLT
jgi:hypothetical protein